MNAKSDLSLFDQRRSVLLSRLPDRLEKGAHWLLEPSRWWIRVPSGLLFCVGGVLSFLPVLGLWMLPLGLLLLAEDVSFCRRISAKIMGWFARRKPALFGEQVV
ncbi:hypothetical protein EDC15_11377 [Acetobacter aceti NBRC 14818]|uniref:hypothetical protein n=1 Tax=Acetobacter aceti TaxID=435 RepID=UPI00022604D6|nr:hypothetical protein [Acetobacter aceti]TCS32043.1 hypothetical protein EDC15_11377 [Acetobacter aceti NBRC 14818]